VEVSEDDTDFMYFYINSNEQRFGKSKG
jgi:hypothetical protein